MPGFTSWDQDVCRRRDDERQLLHVRALGKERHLRHHRRPVSRRAEHAPRTLLPDRPARGEAGPQFDTHAVGDAAIATMLDVYERVDREQPIRNLRWGLSHADFMRPDLVARAARLGVVVDIQPSACTTTSIPWCAVRSRAHELFSSSPEHVCRRDRDRRRLGTTCRRSTRRAPSTPTTRFSGCGSRSRAGANGMRAGSIPSRPSPGGRPSRLYTRNNAYLLFWEKGDRHRWRRASARTSSSSTGTC